VVKNEADMIEETLASASKWCHRIFVTDNGSDDATWELVNKLANANSVIVPHKVELAAYRRTFRADLFQQYRHLASEGDWWCKLDGDEIYFDNPAELLAKVPAPYNMVVGSHFQFYFTDKDLQDLRKDPVTWKSRPVADRIRYYRNNSSEWRFIRHTSDLRWVDTDSPDHTPIKCPERIRILHYRYRSPEQIQKRLEVRLEAKKAFHHEKHNPDSVFLSCSPDAELWRQRIANSEELDYYDGDRSLVEHPESLAPIRRPPGVLYCLADGIRRAINRKRRSRKQTS
jgi:glycosyltransferase involved in cell wall biosynthesis